MTSDRINILEKYYQDDPADPFNAYALALEYLNIDAARSRTLFESLLELHPQYLPTYYHAAKFFHDTGERERAIAIFEKGISLARTVNDKKALRELQSAYDELTF